MIRLWYFFLAIHLILLARQAFSEDGPVLMGVVALLLGIGSDILLIESLTPSREDKKGDDNG